MRPCSRTLRRSPNARRSLPPISNLWRNGLPGSGKIWRASLQQRKALGHIRECHGDLHLGNVALIDDEPVMFDAIEFNPGLRWIDTINDIAFMTMDLQERGRTDLAYRFLDRYLQDSGDYEGLRVLRFYEVYRALVRAKIAAIRSGQADLTEPGTRRRPRRADWIYRVREKTDRTTPWCRDHHPWGLGQW